MSEDTENKTQVEYFNNNNEKDNNEITHHK